MLFDAGMMRALFMLHNGGAVMIRVWDSLVRRFLNLSVLDEALANSGRALVHEQPQPSDSECSTDANGAMVILTYCTALF